MYFSSMPWLCVLDLSIVWIYLYLDCGGSYREPHLLVQQRHQKIQCQLVLSLHAIYNIIEKKNNLNNYSWINWVRQNVFITIK